MTIYQVTYLSFLFVSLQLCVLSCFSCLWDNSSAASTFLWWIFMNFSQSNVLSEKAFLIFEILFWLGCWCINEKILFLFFLTCLLFVIVLCLPPFKTNTEIIFMTEDIKFRWWSQIQGMVCSLIVYFIFNF